MVSDDGGETWAPFEDGLLVNATPKTEPWADGAYYAIGAGRDFLLLGDGNGNKFRRGRDDAAWTRLPDGQMLVGDPGNEPRLEGCAQKDIRMTALMTLVADPFMPGRFLVGGGDRTVQESTDGGRTWHDYAPLRGLVCRGIAFDRHAPGSVVFACRDGLFASDDGGATMRPIEGGLRVPSGKSRFIALDRGRLFFLTSGSGVWGMLLR